MINGCNPWGHADDGEASCCGDSEESNLDEGSGNGWLSTKAAWGWGRWVARDDWAVNGSRGDGAVARLDELAFGVRLRQDFLSGLAEGFLVCLLFPAEVVNMQG